MIRQTMMVAEKATALRRIVLALTVAALMAAIMSLAASPAQAKNCYWLGDTQECYKEIMTPSGNFNDT